MFISIAMYPATRSYDKQLVPSCDLFHIKVRLSRPKNMVASDPSEVAQELLKTPDSEVAKDRLMKDIIK